MATMFYKVWIAKNDNIDGFPLCNIFYHRKDAREFVKELKDILPNGKWRVIEGSLKVAE